MLKAEKDFNITIEETNLFDYFKILDSWMSCNQIPKNYEYNPIGLGLLGFSNTTLNEDGTFNATIKGVKYLGIKLDSIKHHSPECDNIVVDVNFEYIIMLM